MFTNHSSNSTLFVLRYISYGSFFLENKTNGMIHRNMSVLQHIFVRETEIKMTIHLVGLVFHVNIVFGIYLYLFRTRSTLESNMLLWWTIKPHIWRFQLNTQNNRLRICFQFFSFQSEPRIINRHQY